MRNGSSGWEAADYSTRFEIFIANNGSTLEDNVPGDALYGRLTHWDREHSDLTVDYLPMSDSPGNAN